MSFFKNSAALRDTYGETLVTLGNENRNIVVLDADLSGSTKTATFGKAFPERFFNLGIAEADMVGTAIGLALCGKTPFASSFAAFATGRVYDQLRLACYNKANIKIVATHAGLTVGEDGATHQMLEDIALMRALPNMRVIVPADIHETRAAVRYAAENPGPFYVRLTRGKFPVLFDETTAFDFTKVRTVREGRNLAIVACGVMVSRALEAADELAKTGIEAAVVNCSSIKPFDTVAINDLAVKFGKIVTVEEHTIYGGLGSAVAEAVAAKGNATVKIIGTRDTFGKSGNADLILDAFGLAVKDIVSACMEVTHSR